MQDHPASIQGKNKTDNLVGHHSMMHWGFHNGKELAGKLRGDKGTGRVFCSFFGALRGYSSARKSRADFSKVAKKESATACSHSLHISSIVS